MDLIFSALSSHLSPLFWILIGYLSGSIPTGYWLGRLKGIDLTEIGSGSTGATNVLRALGPSAAIITLFVDILKGFLPVYFALELQCGSLLVVFVGVACILGHSKSVFLKFKGGKSSATALGILIAISWQASAVTFAIWLLVIFFSRYSSLGSIIAIPLAPVWLYLFHKPKPYVVLTIFAAIYIVLIRHKDNIRRLIAGTEPRIGEMK